MKAVPARRRRAPRPKPRRRRLCVPARPRSRWLARWPVTSNW